VENGWKEETGGFASCCKPWRKRGRAGAVLFYRCCPSAEREGEIPEGDDNLCVSQTSSVDTDLTYVADSK
jgi:hypothetical protein